MNQRFWWLKPQYEKARCRAHVSGEDANGRRCRNMARKNGLCKTHLPAKYRKKCPTCKRPML